MVFFCEHFFWEASWRIKHFLRTLDFATNKSKWKPGKVVPQEWWDVGGYGDEVGEGGETKAREETRKFLTSWRFNGTLVPFFNPVYFSKAEEMSTGRMGYIMLMCKDDLNVRLRKNKVRKSKCGLQYKSEKSDSTILNL